MRCVFRNASLAPAPDLPNRVPAGNTAPLRVAGNAHGHGYHRLELVDVRHVVYEGLRLACVQEPDGRRVSLVRRIEFRYTPKHGSWLNVAESELSAMTRPCLRHRRVGDLDTLRSEFAAWSTDVNHRQRGVDWQMRVDDARCKLKSVYPKIVD